MARFKLNVIVQTGDIGIYQRNYEAKISDIPLLWENKSSNNIITFLSDGVVIYIIHTVLISIYHL